MDFTMEVVSADDESHTLEMRMVPDPRRYDVVDREGKTYFLDKFLRTLVSLEDMAEQVAGLPMYYLQPSIDDSVAYAERRRVAVESELLTGEHSPPAEQAVPHRDLSADSDMRDLAFLSVDICGSTAYRLGNAEGFDRAYLILLQELGTCVGQFNGSLLKTKGDGFIAFIDHPSFISQCDAAIDLGLSLLVLVANTVNPALVSAGLAPLTIRVGADYGPAKARQVVIPSTGYTGLEVASDSLNRAVKIEETCDPGQFRIGRRLYPCCT